MMDIAINISDMEKQDFEDEITRQVDAMRAEFDWLKSRFPFSEETAEMYYILYNDYQEMAFRDPEDLDTSDPIQQLVAKEAEKIFNSLKGNTVTNFIDMETIDELKERQEAQILKVRTEQLKLWDSLQRQYGKGKVPEDVVAEFGRESMKQNIDLADKLLKERKAVPYYGNILAVEDQITTELRASYDEIQMRLAAEKNQEELDGSQDTMNALMAKIRKGNEPVGY